MFALAQGPRRSSLGRGVLRVHTTVTVFALGEVRTDHRCGGGFGTRRWGAALLRPYHNGYGFCVWAHRPYEFSGGTGLAVIGFSSSSFHRNGLVFM